MLNLSDGVISAYEKVRGNKGNKALERLIAILADKIDPNKKLYCTVGYCDNREIADYMVEKLKAEGLYDDTIIIYTADHGDCLGAHKLIEKGCFTFEEIYHIPMVVKGAGTKDNDSFVLLFYV